MAQSRTIRLASSRFRFSPSRVVAPRETSRLASTLRALAKRRVVYLRRRALTSERASRRASERKSQKLSSVCLRGGPESLAGQQSRLWTLLAAPPLLPVELFALYLAKNWRASLQSASGRAARCASPACVGSRRAAIDRPANNNNNNKLACRRAASQPPATGFRKNTLARVACLSGLSS